MKVHCVLYSFSSKSIKSYWKFLLPVWMCTLQEVPVHPLTNWTLWLTFGRSLFQFRICLVFLFKETVKFFYESWIHMKSIGLTFLLWMCFLFGLFSLITVLLADGSADNCRTYFHINHTHCQLQTMIWTFWLTKAQFICHTKKTFQICNISIYKFMFGFHLAYISFWKLIYELFQGKWILKFSCESVSFC